MTREVVGSIGTDGRSFDTLPAAVWAAVFPEGFIEVVGALGAGDGVLAHELKNKTNNLATHGHTSFLDNAITANIWNRIDDNWTTKYTLQVGSVLERDGGGHGFSESAAMVSEFHFLMFLNVVLTRCRRHGSQNTECGPCGDLQRWQMPCVLRLW